MKEQTQPKFISENAAEQQEEEMSPEKKREIAESAIAELKEGLPEGDEWITKPGGLAHAAKMSHYLNMAKAAILAFENEPYLMEDEKGILVGREKNILYLGGFFDKMSGGKYCFRKNFQDFFQEKISPEDRWKYKLSKSGLKVIRRQDKL
jgi:hypothetical protein